MSELTRITGKDAPLEESIAHLLDRLARHGFDIEEARWLNPVPHVWSVHIRDRRCPLLFTNGKGASRKAALASALGEFVERLSTNYFFADYYLGEDARRWPFAHYPQERWFPIEGEAVPAALLDERLREHYDPEGELTADLLVDMNTGDRERGICALPFTREGDGATVWIPVNILGNLYVSNGLSAGNTRFEARTQALSEVFERHVKNRVIAEGLCLPDVPEHVLARFADVQRAIDALRAQGYRVLVKDASLGGRFPVMNVTLINPDNGGVFASFGAHPRLDVALERTLTELLQGRDLNELDVFQPPSLDLDEVADPHNLETHFIDSSGLIAWEFLADTPDYPFHDWNFSGDTQSEYAHLLALVHANGGEVYVMDHAHLGVPACRLVVPGFSEIYPVDELVYNNNNAGIDLRAPLLNLDALDENASATLLETLDELGLDDMRPVAELLGLAADPGSAWASLRVGELKALLALTCQDMESALDWVDWTLNVGHLSAARTRLYRCLQVLLRLQLDEDRAPETLRPALLQVFGEETLIEAEACLDGRLRFPGLHAPTHALEGFARHRCLLDAWARLQEAKSTV